MKGDSGLSGRFEGGVINVDSKFNGRGLVFRRNRIRNFFDGVHFTPWTVNNSLTNEIDFYENIIDGCIDDFVEADGDSRNVRIFDNYMNRSLSGISVAQALDGPTFIMYNVIGNCGMVPASQRPGSENAGYPFKTNGGTGEETGSGPFYFYHNTGCGKVCVSSGSSGGTRTLPTDSITACGFDQLMGISRLSSEAGATNIMTNAANFASAVIAKTMMASRKIMHSSIRPTVF